MLIQNLCIMFVVTLLWVKIKHMNLCLVKKVFSSVKIVQTVDDEEIKLSFAFRLYLFVQYLEKHKTQAILVYKIQSFWLTKIGNTLFPTQQRLLQATSQIKTEINRLL